MPQVAPISETQLSDVFIGKAPGWIIRSGSSLFLGLWLTLLSIAAFVSYPDVIYAKAVIHSSISPAEIIHPKDGYIELLNITDGQTVSRAELIYGLRSEATREDVNQLQSIVTMLKTMQTKALKKYLTTYSPSNYLTLGQLQDPYNEWLTKLQRWQTTHKAKTHRVQIKNLTSLVQKGKELQKKLAIQEKSWAQILSNQKTELDKLNSLKSRGLATSSALMSLENEYLNQKIAMEDLEIEQSRNQLSNAEVEQRIIELQVEQLEKQDQHWQQLQRAFSLLDTKLNAWHEKHSVFSPIDGRIATLLPLAEDKYIKEGTSTLMVISERPSYMGRMRIKQSGFGKITQGQNVIIELASFPKEEFGQITATVKSMSTVANESGYGIELSIAEPLITNSGFVVPLHQNMEGNAKIVTQERTLLSRIFSKILR